MAAADRRAIDAGTSEGTLIERAGRAVAWHARALLGGSYGRRVVVVCGPGNNGADGLVAARVLRSWGMGVECVRIGRDAPPLDRAAFVTSIGASDLVVDAMFGTGFRDALDGDAEFVASACRDAALVLAVDVPSGVDGATGAVHGGAATLAVEADSTITFAALKPGLLFEPGRSHCGAITVVDIGIEPGPTSVHVWDADDCSHILAVSARRPDHHKWSAAVMVVGGSHGMTGAPLLAARAAQRCGAGMVVAAMPAGAAERASGTEVVTRALASTPLGGFDTAAADDVLADAHRFRAIVCGPGIGRTPTTERVVRAIVASSPRPIVVDADALRLIGTDHGEFRVRHAAGLPPAVLTPHDGEYEALAGHPVGADRITAARALAQQTSSVVVLKGPGTVVATPHGEAFVVQRGGSALATPGTGDVLAGMIAALCARLAPAPTSQVLPVDAVARAAATAVWVHGTAGDRAGLGSSTVAGDVVEAVPEVLQSLWSGAAVVESGM